MKGLVFKSRFTPGLSNAEDVKLNVGDRVEYTCKEGRVFCVIKSELRQHTNGCYGYESLFEDNGEIGFADERRIVSWEGKMGSASELSAALDASELHAV